MHSTADHSIRPHLNTNRPMLKHAQLSMHTDTGRLYCTLSALSACQQMQAHAFHHSSSNAGTRQTWGFSTHLGQRMHAEPSISCILRRHITSCRDTAGTHSALYAYANMEILHLADESRHTLSSQHLQNRAGAQYVQMHAETFPALDVCKQFQTRSQLSIHAKNEDSHSVSIHAHAC